jgi:hypothetical protein
MTHIYKEVQYIWKQTHMFCGCANVCPLSDSSFGIRFCWGWKGGGAGMGGFLQLFFGAVT